MLCFALLLFVSVQHFRKVFLCVSSLRFRFDIMLFSKVLALVAAAGVSGAGLGKGHGLGHGDLKGRQGKIATDVLNVKMT